MKSHTIVGSQRFPSGAPLQQFNNSGHSFSNEELQGLRARDTQSENLASKRQVNSTIETDIVEKEVTNDGTLSIGPLNVLAEDPEPDKKTPPIDKPDEVQGSSPRERRERALTFINGMRRRQSDASRLAKQIHEPADVGLPIEYGAYENPQGAPQSTLPREQSPKSPLRGFTLDKKRVSPREADKIN